MNCYFNHRLFGGISPPTVQEIRQIFQWIDVWVGSRACWISANTLCGLHNFLQSGPWCDIFGVLPKRDLCYLFYRAERVIRMDPSRHFHNFCDHTEALWFNPITCQAQREIRGLCPSSLQTESLSLSPSLETPRRVTPLVTLMPVLTLLLIAATVSIVVRWK